MDLALGSGLAPHRVTDEVGVSSSLWEPFPDPQAPPGLQSAMGRMPLKDSWDLGQPRLP